MADQFTVNQVQGVFGEFKPVLDDAVIYSVNNIQGVFGEFVLVLDEAAGGSVEEEIIGPFPTFFR